MARLLFLAVLSVAFAQVTFAVITCEPKWWPCPGGTHEKYTCIETKRICDGYRDCDNGGDEENCNGGSGGSGGSGGGDVSTGECGQRSFEDHYSSPTSSHGYIVGGQSATRGSLPWQVSIQTWYHFCGGTVINNRWILTAAHCFSRKGVNGVKIIAGEHKFHFNDGTEQAVEVQRAIVHPQYSSRNQANDIALLKLKKDLRFDSYTQPACIPEPSNQARDYQSGDEVIVSGWGRLSSGGSSPSTLQMVKVPFISDNTCKRNNVYGSSIKPSMVCAGVLSGGKDSCQGDSGGPLVKKVDGKWTVLGVVSWGAGCAGYNKPGVYTRVAMFKDWIYATISSN